jgi:hypothetical protein
VAINRQHRLDVGIARWPDANRVLVLHRQHVVACGSYSAAT